jgi:hypothetical protein
LTKYAFDQKQNVSKYVKYKLNIITNCNDGIFSILNEVFNYFVNFIDAIECAFENGYRDAR